MGEEKKKSKISHRDYIFGGMILIVIIVLSIGTTFERTAATPNNAAHQQASSHDQCMACHSVEGVKPQPPRHTPDTQCFRCHKQPAGWLGKKE